MIFENICILCKENGISIARLEREVGLGNATIRGWEVSVPGVDKLKRVADYFGVTVDYILSDSDVSRSESSEHIKSYDVS